MAEVYWYPRQVPRENEGASPGTCSGFNFRQINNASWRCASGLLSFPFDARCHLCLVVKLIQLSRRQIQKSVIPADHAHLNILRQGHHLSIKHGRKRINSAATLSGAGTLVCSTRYVPHRVGSTGCGWGSSVYARTDELFASESSGACQFSRRSTNAVCSPSTKRDASLCKRTLAPSRLTLTAHGYTWYCRVSNPKAQSSPVTSPTLKVFMLIVTCTIGRTE